MIKCKLDDYEVLLSLLANLEITEFPANVPILHNIVHDLSNRSKYKNLLKPYIFQKHAGFYFSPKMEDYLENMCIASLLGMDGMREIYIILPKLRISYERHIDKNNWSKEIEIIKQMAIDFTELINNDKDAEN